MSICAHLRSPVTVLTSLDIPGSTPFRTTQLPRDDDAQTFDDPTANGSLHWAPLHDNGLRGRMRAVTEWVESARPDVVVVDVSVEVALQIRLLGVPVVVMAMPGDRVDEPHDLVYRLAEHIVAAWPRESYEPAWLHRHSAKTTYVGGISRFDGRPRTEPSPGGRPSVLVFHGTGGSSVDADYVHRCAAAVPQFEWSTLGVAGGPWVEDPWLALCAADVVVSSAGQSSVADIAAAGRRAVIVPAERPFAEQEATAGALDRGRLALITRAWPAPGQWAALIGRACSLDPGAWTRWHTRGAASRAAAAIERAAAARPVGAAT